ncbi:calcium-binding protein [Rubellimicrobium rubrum]|uniref:calcium-binding protein n=1 Tax=Rubellimicrobium rubrum TaxID=2585369 RepID=UPI001C3F4A63|nr:calcium-binding protein [Rubellimicrobium rubrum]
MSYDQNGGYGSTRDDDDFRFNILYKPAVSRDLGAGDDLVRITADKGIPQVRLTFTSSEVGNGSALDSNTMANQDGGLAVRAQVENGSGALIGPVSRFDDEGITFDSKGRFTFDVRDLVSGVQRGDQFDVVVLGTKGNDTLGDSGSRDAYYINAGMGDDRLIGGRGDDFLVGGAGNDQLFGGRGDDSFIGGGGNDLIRGGTGDDMAIFSLATDGADQVNLESGWDTVSVAAPATAQQVRLTFTSSEVGNDRATDSNTMANQDGGLAVRLQAEDGSGNLAGLVSRYDDEGIRFASTTSGVTFDVRDLVSGVQRGDQFDVVELGTKGNDVFDARGEDEAYYINAGMGNDRLTGGLDRDFLVGGLGNDRLNGGESDDSLLGGGGNDVFVFIGAAGDDSILDFASGTDRIDLRSFDIDFGDVRSTRSGADTIVEVNSDRDSAYDVQIRLVGVGAAVESDFIFA